MKRSIVVETLGREFGKSRDGYRRDVATGHGRLAAADRPGEPDPDASRCPLLELQPGLLGDRERASTSASSLVTRRSSTKFAATAGSPSASSRWFLRSPSRVSSAVQRRLLAPVRILRQLRRVRRGRWRPRCEPPCRDCRAAARCSPRAPDAGVGDSTVRFRPPRAAASPPAPSAAATVQPPATAARHADSRRRTATAGPSPTTHSRSQTVSSSRRSCDTTSSVAGDSRMKASMASRAGMSRWFVGSSSSSRFDGWMPSSASSSRDRSPPDSARTSLNTSSPRNRKRAR